jgi:hypothetical protein
MQLNLNKNTSKNPFNVNLKSQMYSNLKSPNQQSSKPVTGKSYEEKKLARQDTFLNEHYAQLFLLS